MGGGWPVGRSKGSGPPRAPTAPSVVMTPLGVLAAGVVLGLMTAVPAAAVIGDGSGPLLQAAVAPGAHVANVVPPEGGVVSRGPTTVTADIVGDVPVGDVSTGDVEVVVDGTVVDTDVRRGDGAVTVAGAVADLAAGRHVARVRAVDGDRVAERTWSFVVSPLDVNRIAGTTRVETAAAVAEELLRGQKATAAVLARADDYADALAGVGLAHAVGGPLLLTAPDVLDDAAAGALHEHVHAGGRVHLLGGDDALRPAVREAVEDLGFTTHRLAGATRHETAVAVAEELADVRGARPDTAVVASGDTFADALAMSVPAARAGWPILLTHPEQLPAATAAFLDEQQVRTVEVVGGSAAVGTGVTGALRGDYDVRRTGGRDRYATAASIGEQFFDEGGGDEGGGIALASGVQFPDALSGGVLAAARDVPLLLTGPRLPAVTAQQVAASGDRLWVLGGRQAVTERAVTGALIAAAPGGPAIDIDPAPGSRLAVTVGETPPAIALTAGDGPLTDDSAASLWAGGEEARTSVEVVGSTVTVHVDDLPQGLPVGEDIDVRLRAALHGSSGGVTLVDEDLRVRLQHPLVTTDEGYVALGGTGDVAGREGALRTYSLEVEPETKVDPREFSMIAEAILSDPRGWTAEGGVRLQRVGPGDADVRTVLARPSTVDRICARAGLDTGGYYSCWNGQFAALNLDRWVGGARAFPGPLDVYRAYLVNHEVGHGLGHRHVGCPRAGAPAPVMMQQSKGTSPCVPNAWPFP